MHGRLPPPNSTSHHMLLISLKALMKALSRPFLCLFCFHSGLSLLSSLLSALLYKYFPPILQSPFHPSLNMALSPVTSPAQPLFLLKWKMIGIIYSESERPFPPHHFSFQKLMSTVWIMQHRLLRLLEISKDTLQWRFIGVMWKCTQHSLGGGWSGVHVTSALVLVKLNFFVPFGAVTHQANIK